MLGRRRSAPRLVTCVLLALSLVAGPLVMPGPAAAADDPQSAVSITKSNDTGGKPLQPGDAFTYTLNWQCSGLTVDCVNFTVTDTLPEGLDVTSLPKSTSERDVTYDESTRKLTIVYKQPLDNPQGEKGLLAGQSASVEIGMRVPADTRLKDGTVITNTAKVDADNAPAKDASTDVSVTIPRVVKPVATKSWADGSAVAGSGEESTLTLGVRNNSSSSADVTELSVSDDTADTFEYFDFTGAKVTRFPDGADQAHIVVTTADGQKHTGRTITEPGELPLSAGVDPGDVVGFEVVFTNSDGDALPYDATGGTVEVGLKLRDTRRSDDSKIRPTDKITVGNCATPSAVEKTEGTVAGAQACANYDILPDTLVLNGTKKFFPDTNGNWSQDTGEHAVLGENSPVSAMIDVTNKSPFPVKTITITEPDPNASNEFDKLDVQKIRLRFPDGATSAKVTVSYADGTSTTRTYDANQTIDVAKDGTTVTKVEVVYTGEDENGKPTIKEGADAGLDLHGTLTDAVTEDDLPGGGSPGVRDCAGFTGDAGRTDGSGSASGTACQDLQIESPNTSGTGTKTVDQTSVPPGQPIPMHLTVTNNGNKPLVNPIVTDPPADGNGNPSTVSPWDVLQIDSVSVSPSDAPVTIELWDPAANGGSGAWVPYDASDTALLHRATGVRGKYDGNMAPQSSFTLNLVTERREGVENGVSFNNCYSISAGGDFKPGDDVCSPGLTTGPAEDSASLNKSISPGELPEYVPGLPRQHADATLTVRNTGNMSAKFLKMTDQDDDFFDAVDLVGIKSNQMPAGADRVQIDAYVNGAWVDGTPSASAALPSGVNAADVTGIRATYTSTRDVNDGFTITPCSDNACSGILVLDVSPRQSLRSNGEPVPSHLEDTVSGQFITKVEDADKPKDIDPVNATLDLVKGRPKLAVDKTPDTVLSPGEDAPFYLKVTNTGTANIPNLLVKDSLPPGIEFVDTFQGDGGRPYKIINTQVPDGTPPVPTPVFDQTTDGGRVSGLSWNFGKDANGVPWVFAPGATLTIEIHVRLEAGIRAGDVVTNTMGATSSDKDMTCDGTSQVDGDFGAGTYCTDDATLTAKAGAAFNARKWVSGNDDLGWYNTRTGKVVKVGDDSCLSASDASGRRYTTAPCIALVNPGDRYHYMLRIQNAGTESGTNMRIVDRFPVEGDKGVLLDQDRGTAWDKRPTLASRPTLDGPGTMDVAYENSEPLCTDDLNMGGAGSSAAQCPAGTWDDPFSDQAAGVRMNLAFDPSLQPGGTVNITYAMNTPLDVARNGDPTIAWNSYAHNETTDRNGQPRVLQPNEPVQVGVALAYGDLKLVKNVGEHPGPMAGLLNRLPFPYHVTCTIHPQGNPDQVVLDKDYRVSVNKPVTIEGLPAGAECEVYEEHAWGGQADHPESNPVKVTIRPSVGTPTVKTATITNDFVFGALKLVKKLDGDAAPYAADRTFGVKLTCTFPNAAGDPSPVTLSRTFEVAADKPVTVRALPVNTTCYAEETDTGGAATAVVDHGPDDPVVVTSDANGGPVTITATNTFPGADLVITKHVVGGAAGPYDFALACTTARGDVDLAAGDASFRLRNGQSHKVTVPDGAHCTVVEKNVPTGDTVTFTTSAGGKDGSTDVNGSASIDVTNTFTPGGHTPGGHRPGGHKPGEHGGILPFTGLRGWAIIGMLAAALVLIAAGGLVIARRRSAAG